MEKQTVLFFGSFNPIHIGHLIIAETAADMENIAEVWFVVSPHNPFKPQSSLLNQYDRLHLAELATVDNPRLKASNIEFNLPKPSYTIDTLTYLQERYPNRHFILLMGEDNLQHLHKWKNYEQILKHYAILVYPRFNYSTDAFKDHEKITRLSVPLLDISATDIRQRIAAGKSVRYMLPEPVYQYVMKTSWWRQSSQPTK